MNSVREASGTPTRRCRLARLIESARGIEVRCPEHDHLLGVFTAPGRLEIKCRHDEYVVIEEVQATS